MIYDAAPKFPPTHSNERTCVLYPLSETCSGSRTAMTAHRHNLFSILIPLFVQYVSFNNPHKQPTDNTFSFSFSGNFPSKVSLTQMEVSGHVCVSDFNEGLFMHELISTALSVCVCAGVFACVCSCATPRDSYLTAV